jgi:hypothetical protein
MWPLVPLRLDTRDIEDTSVTRSRFSVHDVSSSAHLCLLSLSLS